MARPSDQARSSDTRRERLAGGAEALTIPHAVAARHLVEDVPLLRAWREYLDLTQADLAQALGVSQAQIAQ